MSQKEHLHDAHNRKKETHLIVVAAIIRDGNRVLIARRAPGKSLAGKWEFPGGKVEGMESPQTRLRTEMREEFDISVTVGTFFAEHTHEHEGGTIRLLAYHAEHINRAFTLRDHDRITWVYPKDLLTFDLAPADIPIAKKIREVSR